MQIALAELILVTYITRDQALLALQNRNGIQCLIHSDCFLETSCWKKFVTGQMLKDYLFTNNKWVAINQSEFDKFLSVVIVIGVYKSNNENVAQLWIKENGRPFFIKLMSRNRYQQILRVLRFDDANSRRRNRSEGKFQNIRDVFEQWDLNLRDAYTPGPHMTVDEQLVVSEEDPHFGSIFLQNLESME